ncbi:MAG: GTPase [Oscillospiraceae bacterium]|nr:GTPase [Oscillospiraceae bacterium]
MARQIPVYLFTGFLEAGKTKFAQETLQDSTFNNGDRMLLLMCEEGVEEYDPAAFAAPNIFLEVIEQESDLTTENLAALLKKHRASYVIVEYNGMWTLDTLYTNMPREWVVAQEFLFIDSRTFLNYNANMRQLMVDKMQSCELVVLNRFPQGDEELKLQAHKIIRAINRRCDIAFETPDGKITYDDIELPLPYDLNAPVVEIADDDFAIFLQDIMDQPEKYRNKTVRLRGKAVSKSRSLKPGYFFFGREVMTCCANDIRFIPLAAECADVSKIKNLGWYTLTARVDIRDMQDVYGGPGPVLHAQSMETAAPPAQEVATFY